MRRLRKLQEVTDRQIAEAEAAHAQAWLDRTYLVCWPTGWKSIRHKN